MEKTLSEAEETAYRQGYIDALKNYAIWKNGEQFVGCLERPLKEVINEFNEKNVPLRY
jgi:hypothetical protein